MDIELQDADATHFEQAGETGRRHGEDVRRVPRQNDLVIGNEPRPQERGAETASRRIDEPEGEVRLAGTRRAQDQHPVFPRGRRRCRAR